MTAQSEEATVDQRLIKAMGHPLRMRVLELLADRVASPSELTDELHEPLGTVAYHVKVLEDNDAIELVRTAPVRGALEHFYRAKIRISRTSLELDEAAYDELSGVLKSALDRALELQAEAAPRLAKLGPQERDARRTALMIMQIHRAADDRA